MKEFWDERYGQEAYVYGVEPNLFFKEVLSNKVSRAGKMLLPAEGEGRNAVFAATLGWDVTAFDISQSGKMKADQLAADWDVSIDYQVMSFDKMDIPAEKYDAVGLIFSHFHEEVRADYFQRLVHGLRSGGVVIMEVFSKNHLAFNSVNPKAGGPKDERLLFSVEEIAGDFRTLKTHQLEEVEVELAEGDFHVGRSSVIRYIGEKI
jgi:cyclopropane fatty-acyl-phospholipid synthase-like methyltransferase